MRTLAHVTLVALVFGGCGKDGGKRAAPTAPAKCARYADLEIQCGKGKEGARSTILDYCAKSADPGKDVMLQLIALESSCAETAADCGAYKACVEQKKRDTAPQL